MDKNVIFLLRTIFEYITVMYVMNKINIECLNRIKQNSTLIKLLSTMKYKYFLKK